MFRCKPITALGRLYAKPAVDGGYTHGEYRAILLDPTHFVTMTALFELATMGSTQAFADAMGRAASRSNAGARAWRLIAKLERGKRTAARRSNKRRETGTRIARISRSTKSPNLPEAAGVGEGGTETSRANAARRA